MSSIVKDINKYFEILRETEGDNLLYDGHPIKLEIEDKQIENPTAKPNSTQQVNAEQKKQNIKDFIKNDINLGSISNEISLESVDKNWSEANDLEDLNAKIQNCICCPLGSGRNKFVFGTGNPNADIMIIGEAPGADEDLKGEPFVGRAGQLLTKILEAIDLSREEVFIANIIKCRPPKNRRPEKIEVDQCEPYLKKQIELIQPQFILALGLTAVETLLKEKYKMGDIRGKKFDYHGTNLLVTYHPAALLRNPHWKKSAWEDVQKLRDMYLEYKKSKDNK